MIIISGGKGIGKTKMLLERAADANGTIVCADPDKMRARAHKYGITGLNIMSYKDITNSGKPVYIHDINKFLSELYGDVRGYTQCVE